jgi:hypothetical protein
MTTSKQYIWIYKIILKIIKLLTLSDDELVKRAPTGSGRAPVASRTGGSGSSGRGLRRGGSSGIGMVTEAATGSCSGTGWASGRGGRSPGAAWAAAETPCGGGGGSSSSAAALLRRWRLVMRASRRDRERMKRCGHGASVKIIYFRQPPRRPSDISLSPTAYLRAVGYKFLSDGHSDNPWMYLITSDGGPWPSNIKEPSDFYCFTVVHEDISQGMRDCHE